MPDARGLVLMICLLVAAPSPSDAFLFGPKQGSDTKCTNEGGAVSVKNATGGQLQDDPCVSCTCKNGTVACERETCPSMKTCPLMSRAPGTCCYQCKTCSYLGQMYNNGDQWGSSQDACRTLSCKAGVITIARMQCITPCHNPQRLVGYCCPVCQPPDVGTLIPSAEMAFLQNVDPCLQCTITEDHWSHCYRTACPALDCPLADQYTPSKKCCPECKISRVEKWSAVAVPSGKSCPFQSITYSHLQSFRPDDCTLCKCEDGSVICKRFVCPTIDCPSQRLYFRPGLCCPFCRDRDPLSCTYPMGDTKHKYKHGETWSPTECTNCTCANGESKCEQQKCEHSHKCPRGYIEKPKEPGQCCRQCVEKEATCTVFGDPHYQTFDGFAYTFQGTCRYVLAQECTLRGDKPSFIVVAHNGPWERLDAAWTKHVTIRLQPPGTKNPIHISLLPKKRVKEQGVVRKLPFAHFNNPAYTVAFDQQKNVVFRATTLGLKVLWDGHSYVEVTLTRKHQGKVCGLCGNYNHLKDDDTVPQFGSEPAEEINDFAQSWRWGSADKCEAESDRAYHEQSRLSRRDRKLSQLKLLRILGPVTGLRPTPPGGNMLNAHALLRVFRGSGRDGLPLTLASDADSEQSLFPHWSSQKLSLFRYDVDGGRRLGDSMEVAQNGRASGEKEVKQGKKRRRKQPKKRRSLKKLCGGSAKWRTRQDAIKQCQLLKSDVFRACRGVVKVGHYFRWCVQDACACPASGRCFCESLMAYGRECERHDVVIDWRPHSRCTIDEACTVAGAEFSSCTCERTCESPTRQCDEATCKPGCECPANSVELDGRCVPLEQCPPHLSPPPSPH